MVMPLEISSVRPDATTIQKPAARQLARAVMGHDALVPRAAE
jgi:hypothetical protein